MSADGRVLDTADHHAGVDSQSNHKNGATPLLRLDTGIAAGSLPGTTPAIASHTQGKASDMGQSTRTSGSAHSGTPASAVTITPVLHSGSAVPTAYGLQ